MVVIADMSRTAFCDSSGIRHLLIANDRASNDHAQLRVVIAAEQVLHVLRMTGVNELLDIYPSLQRALAGEPPGSLQTAARATGEMASAES